MESKLLSSQVMADIYAALGDAESRALFLPRLEWCLRSTRESLHRVLGSELEYASGETEEPLYTMVDKAIQHAKSLPSEAKRWFIEPNIRKAVTLPDFLAREDCTRMPVVLYGAGRSFNMAIRLLARYHLNILCVCDRDESKQGSFINGLEIISPKQLRTFPKNITIIISGFYSCGSIYKDIRGMDIPDERIVWMVSREFQYFGPAFIQPAPNEIYVDCGAMTTGTIEDFVRFCEGGYEKIFAFEPNANSWHNIQNVLHEKGIANVELINKGCWHENATLGFDSNAEMPGSSRLDVQSANSIEVVTIDSVVGESTITFIKMDIEGSELNALHGAANTIKRCKPRLAISLYHKPSDIIDIPAYLLSLVPEYTLYIRQHTYFLYETVLYAVL